VLNVGEEAVAGEASWSLERLAAPRELLAEEHDLPLTCVLAHYPTSQTVAQGRVRFNAEGKQARVELPTLAAGGYRINFVTTDPWGQKVRGAHSFLVADAKTRSLPLAVPPLAIARESDAQIGQSAQFLIGGTQASGVYHVELWRGDILQMHRLERGAPVRVVEVPVRAEQADGFTLRWLGVAGLTIKGAEASVRVPRKDKALTVTFKPRADSVAP